MSIILVVFTHCYEFSICTFRQNDEIYARIIRSSISGASAFFVFISGFLFLKLYKTNSNYSNFIFSKVKKLYFPFLFFSSLDIIYLLLKFFSYKFTGNQLANIYYNSIVSFDYLSTYVYGKSFIMLGVLWYIPFIMNVYLLSPLFLLFAKTKFKFQMMLLSFSIFIGLFLFRNNVPGGLALIQNVIYFSPYYLLGIILSQKEELLVNSITTFKKFILSLLIFLCVFCKNYLPINIVSIIDFIFLQKLLICILFLSLSVKNTFRNGSILDKLALNSYGIFFIHALIILLFSKLTNFFQISIRSNSILVFLLVAIIALFISLFFVLLVKKILGHKSRYLIGV